MPIKLVISKESDSAWREEREFGQDEVSIGRDSVNTLHLADPENIVSRRHARLTCEDGEYFLMDCGSHNYTYLNDERIARHIPYRLNNGARIRIGYFQLEFYAVDIREAVDSTIVALNPFHLHADQLRTVLEGLRSSFDDAPAMQRESQVRLALQEAFYELGEHPLRHIFADEAVAGRKSDAPAGQSAGSAAEAEKSAPGSGEPGGLQPPDPENPDFMGRIGYLQDIVLRAVIRLARASAELQMRFQEKRPETDVRQLHDMSPEELKAHVLSDEVSEKESHRRLGELQVKVDTLLKQYEAVLDACKISQDQRMVKVLERFFRTTNGSPAE